MTVINNKNISGITSINAQSNSLELFNSAGVSLLDLNTNSVTFPGNVAIGGAVPDTLLHLQGDQPKLRIESTNSLDASLGTEEIARIEFEATKFTNRNVAASMRVRQDGTWSTVDDWFSPTAIEFYTQDQSGTEVTTPRFTINRDGNIGIGTDSPTQILHLSSNSNQTSIKLSNVGTGGTDWYVQSSGNTASNGQGNFSIYNGLNPGIDGYYLSITGVGDIGIGITNPAEKLSVAGNVRVENSTDASQYLTISHQGIDFQNTGAGSSTTSSAHLLDDYEEGTFNPFATVAGNFTGESTKTGRYTRIGNLVHCDLRILWTGTTGTGELRLDLPFAEAGTTGESSGHTGIVFYSGISVDASAISTYIPKNSSTVRFYPTDGGSFSAVTLNNVNGTYDWIVSFSYYAA